MHDALLSKLKYVAELQTWADPAALDQPYLRLKGRAVRKA